MNARLMIRLALLLASLAVGTTSWAHKFHLTASQIVPGASGDLDANADKNGNTEVEMKILHLAKPSQLTPPATAYIVWFQQQGSDPANEGELKIGDKMRGEFKTSTPWKNFDVFITAESDPQVKSPSGQVVLRTTVQQ